MNILFIQYSYKKFIMIFLKLRTKKKYKHVKFQLSEMLDLPIIGWRALKG